MRATLSRPADDGQVCPHCGSAHVLTVECLGGPHHSRTRCRDCGRHIRFNAKPWDLQRAESFTVPYGKFKGQRVADLAADAEGRRYLRWAAGEWKGNVATAIKIGLGIDPGEGGR